MILNRHATTKNLCILAHIVHLILCAIVQLTRDLPWVSMLGLLAPGTCPLPQNSPNVYAGSSSAVIMAIRVVLFRASGFALRFLDVESPSGPSVEVFWWWGRVIVEFQGWIKPWSAH